MATSLIDETSSGRDSQTAGHLVLSLAIWLVAVVIACFFALMLRDSTVVEDLYIPRTNDSFYHARRILDAAVGDRGFYQFDERLHVPDGAWIPWPWAYDYLLAQATKLALWLRPGLDPMAFLVHVPVAWIPVNAALFSGAAAAAGLSLNMRAIAMLAFALSPLTQLLHGIGMLDHHYIEHTFILASAWIGLSWFRRLDDARLAGALGAILGLAQAFHNGLFLLQLPVLVCAFLLWLRQSAPPRSSAVAFAVSLVLTTQLVLLPSEPYLEGMFEFGLLSWFHFYAACCTALVVIYFAWLPFSTPLLAGLFALVCLLSLPIAVQALQGAAFLSSNFSILQDIVEARSPYRLFTDTFGPIETVSHYSWLLLIAPLLIAFYGYRLLREASAQRLFYATFAVFGLGMLLAQFRFHYYGLFPLVTGGLLIVDRVKERFRWHTGGVLVGTLALVVLAYQPALRERLFIVYAPGGDPEYASALAIYLDLAEQCAADPGVVLASTNDGNPILFHTDCSVFANNFILRAEDEEKIAEIGQLMASPLEAIRSHPLDIKYLFVRAKDFVITVDGVERFPAANSIAKMLFLEERAPEGFNLVRSIYRRLDEDGEARVHALLYKIE